MSSEIAIKLVGVGKNYHIYAKPQHRLLQMLAGNRKTYYRDFWAVKDISFTIHKGETVGIIGRNGSGKSTLLQMICGTLTPTTGTIEVNGRVAALLELGAGFNPEFTGRENVYMNAAMYGVSRAEVDTRLPAILTFADIGDFIDQPVKTYSSGMYVRLAFAIAINTAPDILIVDEALSVGDVRFQAKCMRRIKEIQELGTTILFVSHDISAVRTLCQRALWLDAGRVRMIGDIFPTSAEYIEYMFKDDMSGDKGIAAEKSASSEENGLDHRPVTHWGSHIGAISVAGIFNQLNERVDVLHWNEKLTVRITFKIPTGIDLEYFGVAFSIKDTKGTDLIVSSTHDQHLRFSDVDTDSVSVEFSFLNPLVTGKYLLVAALEDCSSSVIHYYEYIEGAQYFSSLAEKRYFGIFQPEIKQFLMSKKI